MKEKKGRGVCWIEENFARWTPTNSGLPSWDRSEGPQTAGSHRWLLANSPIRIIAFKFRELMLPMSSIFGLRRCAKAARGLRAASIYHISGGQVRASIYLIQKLSFKRYLHSENPKAPRRSTGLKVIRVADRGSESSAVGKFTFQT